MKVVYLGRPSRRISPPPALDGDVIELLSNDWDDYSYKTSFQVTCRVGNQILNLDPLRLLIEDEHTTSTKLNQLINDGWDGEFPIPEINYISVPSEIAFYEQLEGTLGLEGAIEVANLLRDASYFVHVVEDEGAKALVESGGFKKSLQRERGCVKAYLDAWRIFERKSIAVLDLGFKFLNIFDKSSTLNLKFHSETPLPHDINVLIGPNGCGKSQLLHQIVRDWISPSGHEGIGFLEKPNLSQIIVVSYSPFEHFPVDLTGKKLQDFEAYRYFGFRGRAHPTDANKSGRISLSREIPKRNAAQSLMSCLADDKKYHSIRDWGRKVETVERVLKTAIDFDYATLEVSNNVRARSFYTDPSLIDTLNFDVKDEGELCRYIPIAADRIEELNEEKIISELKPSSGVTFFRDSQPVKLSSGQRLFMYIVIDILGAIRRNSLILVDEPELFLHPTLEIQFVNMLKEILTSFNSKALLATHSVVTVREMPADCVHVFEKTKDDLILKQPPFQTFGGDFQRISSYVFGDKSVSKPFESWLKTQFEEFGSADNLIEMLKNELNEELIVQIKAMELDRW